MEQTLRVAILGGGPAGIFMFKRLIESGDRGLEITIFEKKDVLGCGMPYSKEGANDEHITNVSGNEIPTIVTPISDWIKTVPQAELDRFNIDREKFSDYKVLPRLLFGGYLSAQFQLLLQQADEKGIKYHIRGKTTVTDVADNGNNIIVTVDENETINFDKVIICTGHYWPKTSEGKVPGFYDSPYPPSKLQFKVNRPVALSGSSLTAVDAIRTLTRHNGTFRENESGELKYYLNDDSKRFKIVMHTRNGLLPAVRFHLEDSHLEVKEFLSREEIDRHIADNNGFLSLDFLFEKDFKEILRQKRPGFYEMIKRLNMEEFVAEVMSFREEIDPFNLLEAEYAEAERSIKRKESVYWKELLGALSFTMNYPAKHFSAEDMLRLQKVLLPLISVIIAYIPQSSAKQLIALHKAGLVELIAVGDDSEVNPGSERGATYSYTGEDGRKMSQHFDTYINCIGQPHLSYKDFPFKSLMEEDAVVPARLKFRSFAEAEMLLASGNKSVEKGNDGQYYLNVQGIAIDDNFRIVNTEGKSNLNIYMMAVPYMGGFNPDYSGLDFCEEASARIMEVFFN